MFCVHGQIPSPGLIINTRYIMFWVYCIIISNSNFSLEIDKETLHQMIHCRDTKINPVTIKLQRDKNKQLFLLSF